MNNLNCNSPKVDTCLEACRDLCPKNQTLSVCSRSCDNCLSDCEALYQRCVSPGSDNKTVQEETWKVSNSSQNQNHRIWGVLVPRTQSTPAHHIEDTCSKSDAPAPDNSTCSLVLNNSKESDNRIELVAYFPDPELEAVTSDTSPSSLLVESTESDEGKSSLELSLDGETECPAYSFVPEDSCIDTRTADLFADLTDDIPLNLKGNDTSTLLANRTSKFGLKEACLAFLKGFTLGVLILAICTFFRKKSVSKMSKGGLYKIGSFK